MTTLYVDISRSALVVSPQTTQRCLPPALTVGDTVPLTLAFLQRNPQPLNTGQPLYNYVDMSGADIVLSLGPNLGAPISGSFPLTLGANSVTVTSLVSSYDLTVALNSLASVTTAGGVAVSGPVGGPFRITFLTNGAQTLITSGANALVPLSTVTIATDVTGTSSNPAVQVLTLAQAETVQVTDWTPQSAAAVTVTQLQTNAIQQVSIPAGTYGGTFNLTINGLTTPALPFNAQFDLIQSAINTLLGITTCTVVAGQNTWVVTIPANTFAITGSALNLQIPLTITGSLNLTSQALKDLLAGQTSAAVPFLIQSTAGGVQTLYSGFV